MRNTNLIITVNFTVFLIIFLFICTGDLFSKEFECNTTKVSDKSISSSSNCFFKDDKNIFGANYSNKNLSGCIYDGYSFMNTDFSNSDLSNASFENAKFFESNIDGANLSSSNLKNAKTYKSSLDDANLSFAKLDNTSFEKTSFKNTIMDENNTNNINIINSNYKFIIKKTIKKSNKNNKAFEGKFKL